MPFKKVLIANRGEIALRILRACKELGIKTVAVHSTADNTAMHVRLADESVCIGPPAPKDSYLNMPAILSAAIITGADAIHPGVGFLSENADFAEMVEDHDCVFIGPTPDHIRLMGDKIRAKEAARDLGLPCIPGSDGEIPSEEAAMALANEIGFPLIIKAASGGGGRGMKVVHSQDKIAESFAMCRSEALMAFGNDAVYMEKYLGEPRHIEIQIIGDGQGGVIHLGERDCSVQRRHQKVIEEAPSPVIDAAIRAKIGDTVIKAMRKIKYRGAGTIEFLYEKGAFYFIEMNTRLQVEHPITEEVCQFDLVREQISIAAGLPLSVKQADVSMRGHAIECRITAEHPESFQPSAGLIRDFHPPGGRNVRMDSHIYASYKIPPYYDSLIAKLVVHGADRNEAIMRLRRALEEFVITGIHSTIPLHQKLIEEKAFQNGHYDIHWLENLLKKA